MALLAGAVVVLAALNLFRTHIGRAFIAVRDRDIAAEIIGINIFRTKLTAFAVSSFYAGVTGVVYTYYLGMANYEAFTLPVSIQYLAMVIIGGLGSVLGSILGAAFITLLPITLDIVLSTDAPRPGRPALVPICIFAGVRRPVPDVDGYAAIQRVFDFLSQIVLDDVVRRPSR